jgi:hypothetical protein
VRNNVSETYTNPGEVSRQFMDQEVFFETFEEAVFEFPLEEQKIVVYYGVGVSGGRGCEKNRAGG